MRTGGTTQSRLSALHISSYFVGGCGLFEEQIFRDLIEGNGLASQYVVCDWGDGGDRVIEKLRYLGGFAGANPFSKKTFNLTQGLELMRQNPEQARALQQAADAESVAE